MNNPFGMVGQFKQFVDNFQKNINRNPQEVVQELLNSGQMTQAQFNQLREQANKIMGTHN
jgi:hypothetical protein